MSGEVAAGQAAEAGAAAAATTRLVDILLAGLKALAATGEVDAACRLAGQACVALRHVDATAAQRFNVLLHRLTPRLEK